MSARQAHFVGTRNTVQRGNTTASKDAVNRFASDIQIPADDRMGTQWRWRKMVKLTDQGSVRYYPKRNCVMQTVRGNRD